MYIHLYYFTVYTHMHGFSVGIHKTMIENACIRKLKSKSGRIKHDLHNIDFFADLLRICCTTSTQQID